LNLDNLVIKGRLDFVAAPNDKCACFNSNIEQAASQNHNIGHADNSGQDKSPTAFAERCFMAQEMLQ
jgi:hypothetical protein